MSHKVENEKCPVCGEVSELAVHFEVGATPLPDRADIDREIEISHICNDVGSGIYIHTVDTSK